MFFNNQLVQLPNYETIEWDNNCFGQTAKLSQLVYFLKNIFDTNKKICLIDHISQIFDNANNINNSDIDLVIVNASDHPMNFTDLQTFTKPVIFLNHNFNDKNYHPWHILWSHWMSLSDEEIDFTSPRTKSISCLYVKTRITRVFNIVELKNKWYFDKIYMAWIDRFNTSQELMHEDGLTATDIEKQWETYLEIEKNVPLVSHVPTELDSCLVLGPGYTDTYLNIVLEARPVVQGFLTEKICKPIRAGQLFLVQASEGTVQYLRNIGFDTFDDYIDHARYDSEPDWKRRTQLMHSVLDEIMPNLKEIFDNTAERRKRNCELLKSPQFVAELLKTLK